MTDSPSAANPATTSPASASGPEGARFEALDRALAEAGPAAALDRLIADLEQNGPPRALLDALLLKARHELGLPLLQDGPLGEIAEPVRTKYEDRYLEAIRHVGQKLLDEGDIPGAWPYFRAIGEKDPIVAALDAVRLDAESDAEAGTESAGQRLSMLIDIAFHQGAHPRRGFELILEHYGPCSAISAFEHLPAESGIRVPSAERLVRYLHEQLVASVRADISRHGEPDPPESAPLSELVADRPWLFAEDNYHIDISHLNAVVRLGTLLTDPEAIRLAIDLTEYGRRLSPRYQYEGEPPFERIHEDYGVYLRALIGEDQEAAIAHFRAKLDPDESLPAQVLVCLLERIGRLDEAITVAAENLAGVPESMLMCSTVPALCRRAGRLDRLAEITRGQGDLVHYTAARLQARGQPSR